MDTNIEIGESIYWYVNNDWIYSKNNNWPTLKGNKPTRCPWKSICVSQNPHYKWFDGGYTNASFNELDIHMYQNKGSFPLFIFEGESTTTRIYSVREFFWVSTFSMYHFEKKKHFTW